MGDIYRRLEISEKAAVDSNLTPSESQDLMEYIDGFGPGAHTDMDQIKSRILL